jgi:hypothetical protein
MLQQAAGPFRSSPSLASSLTKEAGKWLVPVNGFEYKALIGALVARFTRDGGGPAAEFTVAGK